MKKQPLMTPEALLSTIETDQQVNRWFEYLIVQPSIKNDFLISSNKRLFQRFLKYKLFKRICLLFLIYCFIQLSVHLKDYRFYLFIGASLGILIILSKHLRNLTALLSLELTKKDFDPSILSQMTLYTLSEFYSHKYQIPSLVDVLSSGDENLRTLILSLFVALLVIYPFFTIQQTIILFTVAFLISKSLMNSDFFYKFLR